MASSGPATAFRIAERRAGGCVTSDPQVRSSLAFASLDRPRTSGAVMHRLRTRCRACDGTALRAFLSLGPQPLANAFLSGEAEFGDERFFPLDVYCCDGCGLVQLLDVIDPEALFGHYLYVSGVSETMAAHFRGYAWSVTETLSLSPADLVVEIASNDGSLLACFAELGVRTLGVEPARNIAAMARARGIDTVSRFFDYQVGRELAAAYGTARAVVANNVLAHVDNPRSFLAGCAELIADDGRIVVEVPYAADLLARCEYDTIYHEHLCYFTVGPLARIGESAGLAVARVDRMPVHGGTIRVWFRKGSEHAPGAQSMMQEERDARLTDFATWADFGRAAAANREALRSLLQGLHEDGRCIAAYCAPAKGNTLLNYCGIDTSWLPFTVDRSPLKVGKLTPGMHIPVRPVDTVLERQPDYLLILAWNFAEEIMAQQAAYREAGGRFILPLPSPRVV